jgi:hypothetical protein
MQVAHDHGIVHRDLKPENVLLAEPSGGANEPLTPKITDFGLAKRLQETTGRTRTGEIMGTPSYMAPEQAAGTKNIGPAADVYALGAILYRLLTGRPPFQADTSLDTMMLVLEQEPVPLRTLNKMLPRDLETIALRCLAKEPVKRYASTAELADDLRRFLDGEPIKARRLSAHQRFFRWCRKRPGAAVARGALALVLLAFFLISLTSRGIAGLDFLALMIGPLISLGAMVRTKLRPFLIGLSVSLLLAIVVISFFRVKDPWLRITDFSGWHLLKSLFPRLNSDEFTILACFLPLLIGLTGGVFFSLRWRILGYCLVMVLWFAALQWPELINYLLVVVAPGLYFGIVCRIVCWYNKGNLIDSIIGSVLGTVIGFFLGIMVFAFAYFVWFGKHSDPLEASIIMILQFIPGPTIGSILGAYLGAISGRNNTRRGHSSVHSSFVKT